MSDSGIETEHEDLDKNLLENEHRNYNNDDNSWVGFEDTRGHGTSVAGLIGAIGGNGTGSYGVAYNAQMAGFYYIGIDKTTYSKENDQARGNFDIFNYSYGLPTCKYRSVDNSGYIEQLKYGVSKYREGKGAIYVKSGGNYALSPLRGCDESLPLNITNIDHFYLGNSSLNGYHSWPYQIVVGAFNAEGKHSSYSSPGSVLWISSPGGEHGRYAPAMVTTDLTGCHEGYSKYSNSKNNFDNTESNLNSDCQYTSTFTGTSSSTPVTSGIIAMMLEANGELSWRDVKYILAKTADQLDASIGDIDHPREDRRLSGHTYLPGWVTNKAGFKFHNYYGFGGINARAAVEMAERYTSSLETFVESSWTDSNTISSSNAIPDVSKEGLTNVLSISDNNNLTIEMVQIELSVTHPRISDIGVELISPGGTKSVIIPINSNINGSNMNSWILASNAFYGESSRGNWSIKLIDGLSGETGTLTRWKIKFFGY